jgi:hypothetical protein
MPLTSLRPIILLIHWSNFHLKSYNLRCNRLCMKCRMPVWFHQWFRVLHLLSVQMLRFTTLKATLSQILTSLVSLSSQETKGTNLTITLHLSLFITRIMAFRWILTNQRIVSNNLFLYLVCQLRLVHSAKKVETILELPLN